ncbi:FAD binding domain-containing protein [Paenibacillus sp. FJAT-27812]|uniref:FAD binding domain-containing protein n=1 Tax=Paenibacillus sp. FJAT-27812 TaxID=1684143 RepID=UPI0009E9C226|nr:FAD binding domain-containing protein [Paenibacillus sp. FJAT-27812]
MGMNVQETMASPLVWHPQTAAEAWQLKQTYAADSIYISGGTLLRTHWESGIAAMPKHLIDLSAVRGLNEMRIGETGLLIGGQTSLQACRTNTLLQRHFPLVSEATRTIAAPSVRQLATLGGNVASNIGDSIAALLAYEAEVLWYNGVTEQLAPLSEWLSAASDQGRSNERLLLSIQLPFESTEEEAARDADDRTDSISKMKRFGAYHKIGRREAFTPSVVTAAIKGAISNNGNLEHIRIALGGGQTIPQRLEQLEMEIVGAAVDAKLLQHVYDRIPELYETREDLFASAAYRKATAANVIVAELWKVARH